MAWTTVPQALAIAQRYQQAGRWAEVEDICRQVLAGRPAEAEALHLLGLACARTGRSADGLGLLRRALAASPADPRIANNFGVALRSAGRLDEAAAAFRQALAHAPHLPEPYVGLGNVLADRGRFAEAAAQFEQALARRPDFATAHSDLAGVLNELGRHDEAIAHAQAAIAARPGWAAPHVNLGVALGRQQRFDAAEAAFRAALAHDPHVPPALASLANVLREQGRLEEAQTCCRQALAADPRYAPAHLNYATLLEEQGQHAEALAACRRAVALQPGLVDARLYHALLLLRGGDLAAGFAEYEWRWRSPQASPAPRFRAPAWDGRDPRGKTVLLYSEQGLGDTLHFVRYAPRLAARGARVVLACQRDLAPLLRTVPGLAAVAAGEDRVPPFDLHAPLLSLPRLFGTTLDSIPADVPYVHAPPASVERWRAWLAERCPAGARRIGLAWAGRPTHRDDRHRSLRLADLAPLAAVPGVQFVSLQKGPAAAQLAAAPAGLNVLDAGAELGDFADTAGLLTNLDLLLAVDTAVVHLAGALARPAWVLLATPADWRWLRERADSPWYPTLRLYRQPRRGAWAAVIQRVAEDLRAPGRA